MKKIYLCVVLIMSALFVSCSKGSDSDNIPQNTLIGNTYAWENWLKEAFYGGVVYDNYHFIDASTYEYIEKRNGVVTNRSEVSNYTFYGDSVRAGNKCFNILLDGAKLQLRTNTDCYYVKQ